MKSDYAVNDTTKKNCIVRVAFDNGYEVERFRKHKEKGNGLKIYKDGKYLSELERGSTRDSQRVLEGLLGISFETFTKAVVLGDNAAMNFLMSDSKRRRETIEELLEMDIFDLFLVEARERRKGIQQQVDQETLREEAIARDVQLSKAEMERENRLRQNYEHQLQTLTESAELNSQRLIEWEHENATLAELEKSWHFTKNHQRVRDKWALYQLNLKSRQMTDTILGDLRQQAEEVKARLQQVEVLRQKEAVIRSTTDALATLQGPNTVEVQADVARREQQVHELDNQIARMGELIGQGRCPTCQQTVTQTKMNKPEQLLASQRASAVSALNTAIAKKQALGDEVASVASKLDELLDGKGIQEFLSQQGQRQHLITRLEQLEGKVREQEQAISATPEPAHVLKDLKMSLDKIEGIVSSDDSHANDPAESRAAHQANQTTLLEEKYRLQSEVSRLKLALDESERRHNEFAERVLNLEGEQEELNSKRDHIAAQLQLIDFWEKGFDKRTLKSAEFPTMRSYMLAQSVQVII